MLRIALILLLLMNITARGQTPMGLNKDSLRWILMTHPADTAKIGTLLLLAHQFGNAQPDSAIFYFREADQLSHALNFGRYRSSGQAPWSTILVVGVLLLAVALSIGILLYYRQRRLLGLQALEVLRVREENTRLKALLEGRVNEQQLISLEIQNEIGSGLASLLSLSGRLSLSGDTDPATFSTDPTPITAKPASIIPKPTSNIADPTTVTAEPIPTTVTANPTPITAHPATITISPTTVTTTPITIFKMQQTAQQLIRKTNEIAWMLDHKENSLGSLITNIRRNATELLEQANIDLRFYIDDDIPEMAVTQEFRRDVYLIVKEAVYNAVRHSGASVVEISIHIDAGEMTIVVGDNGKGIYKAGGNHWGNGMKDMQRRVEQIDGRMEITAGAGTAITIVSPLPYL